MAAEDERDRVLSISIWDVPLQHLFSIVTGFYRKGERIGLIYLALHARVALIEWWRVMYSHHLVTLAEKDNLQLYYEQKVQLLALYKQEKYGPHSPEKDSETGYFDIIGADRRCT